MMTYKEQLNDKFPFMQDLLNKPFITKNENVDRYLFELLSLLEVQPAFSETELLQILPLLEPSKEAFKIKGAAYLIEEANPNYVLRQVGDTWYIINMSKGVM